MLTFEAMRERRWGSYPMLRTVLEGKEVPAIYFGITSADDNLFDATVRLMEIAVTAEANRDGILEIAQSGEPEQMRRDLELLIERLRSASAFFRERIGAIEAICRELYSR